MSALPQYFYPGLPPLYQPGPVLVRTPQQCILFGCVDQTLVDVVGSVVSGVNGTIVGAGDGITGIVNGKNQNMILVC